jgi:hypothetical protein
VRRRRDRQSIRLLLRPYESAGRRRCPVAAAWRVFAFPVGAPLPITSGWYWALLGFDLAMRVRNAVCRPPLVMYYRTGSLSAVRGPRSAVRNDLTACGFTVSTVPLTALGRREDGSPKAGWSSHAQQARPKCCVRRWTASDPGLSSAGESCTGAGG